MLDPMSRRALARAGGELREPVPAGRIDSRVSVVVPCYNYGHYLPACVASALDQTGVAVEVIIVDDASPDGSGEIAERIAAGDDRVSVVRHKQNAGHLSTYNDGFARATGDYLVQLSADDLLPPGALARAVALLEQVPALGFVYGYAAHFAGNPPPPTNTVRAWITWHGEDWVRARCRSGFNVIQTTEVVMRTSVVRQVGGYRLDLPHSGDLELWMRMATISDVGFVAGPEQAWYRLHDSNMHNAVFDGGTMEGQFIDLEHRWLAFDALLSGPTGKLTDPSALATTVRTTLATEALERANDAYMRGFREFPVDKFEQLAERLVPTIGRTPAGRALSRRKKIGMKSMPVNPLWAPRGVAHRVDNWTEKWTRRRVGV